MATLLRQWLDNASLRVDDMRGRLTPDHFADGRVPGRSALYERLAGVALRQDFIEAVADICSSSGAAQKQLLDEVLATRQRARAGTTAGLSRPTTAEAQLVIVQQRSIEVSDRLLRALERQQQLERERNDANQMVLILLAMVDKLHRDITTLNRERDRLRVFRPAEENLNQVYERLTRSEQQRDTAETELERAKAERQKADQLAEEAADQVRLLTEELERLRGEAPEPTVRTEAETAAPAVQTPLDVEADDIDAALSKAARHLDDRADRLDQLASELHLDNPPDNPPTSNDSPDNWLMSDWEAAIPAQVVDEVRALVNQGKSDDHELQQVLRDAGRALPVTEVLRTAVMLLSINLPDEAAWLFDAASARTEPADMPVLISALHHRGQDAELYQVLNQVARHWPAPDLTEAVASLREENLDSDAYQMLSAVGRASPPLEVLKVLARLAQHDADWVVEAACRDRPVDELPALEAALRQLRAADATKVAAAYERQVTAAASRGAAVHLRPRPTNLRAGASEDDGDDEYPLLRPFAMSGGRTRPRYVLPPEAVVRTTATPDQLQGLLSEHRHVCEVCQEPCDLRTISKRLAIPLAVARIVVADLGEAGLVEIDAHPRADEPVEMQSEPLPSEERSRGLPDDERFGFNAEAGYGPAMTTRQVRRELRAPKPEKLRVLLLGASSDGDLRVGREQQRIRAAVQSATHNDLVELDVHPAATADMFLDALRRFRPHVVHFSGHSAQDLIAFEQDVDGFHQSVVVSAGAFARAIAAVDDKPLLVLLNPCHSAAQTASLVETVPFTICMSDSIGDLDATTYVARFYAAVTEGQSVQAAHLLSQAAVAMNGLPDHDLPTLACAPDIDPSSAKLVTPPPA
ncbi:DUF742 domain-containing protein [Streptomyces chartreusis]|uniref:DUF742 domain-containing protein n=1 Tax=Streptomyces chartreusis TaxID=1969 RepID=UPI0036853253